MTVPVACWTEVNAFYVISPGNKAPASSVYFDYDASDTSQWVELEEAAVAAANQGSLPITFRPTTQCFTQKTDNKYSPIGYIGG